MKETGSGEMTRSSRAALAAGGVALRLLASTWRYEVRNGSALESLRSARTPFIFSLWHGELLPLLWHHRRQRIAVLISEHRDGELVARTAKSLGYALIRGSTTRGAERALLGLVRHLRDGGEVAVTPDGPRGPAKKIAPGALIAAHRADVPILPIRAVAKNAWRLRSWDGFIIPKPFSRVVVAYASPMRITASDARDASQQTAALESLMDEAGKTANA